MILLSEIGKEYKSTHNYVIQLIRKSTAPYHNAYKTVSRTLNQRSYEIDPDWFIRHLEHNKQTVKTHEHIRVLRMFRDNSSKEERNV